MSKSILKGVNNLQGKIRPASISDNLAKGHSTNQLIHDLTLSKKSKLKLA